MRQLHSIHVPKRVVWMLALLALAALFYFKALSNYRTHDYINSNFFSFWLSGHMVWTGQSPYDAAQFQAGFDEYGATYRPSKILQYPLPVMYLMAPIGALPVGTAYFAWVIISEAIVALAVYVLLRRQQGVLVLFPLLTVAMLFFGPVYLSLQVGSVGVISLLAMVLAILLLQNNRPFLAGVLCSLTFLKPPQALTLMLLVGIWFVFRRQWKAILGIGTGGLAMLVVWALRDPLWLVKFRSSSDFLLGHTRGVQSNVYSFAYSACGENVTCMWVTGTASAIVLIVLAALILWRYRSSWTDWQALSLIIPLGFVSAVYLWSYDQLLYVIPITWIAAQLLIRTRSYLSVLVFVIVLAAVSFVALAIQAATQQDRLSLATTLLVLGMYLWLGLQKAPAEPLDDTAVLRPT